MRILDIGQDQIIEIEAIVTNPRDRSRKLKFNQAIMPERSIHQEATDVHGIRTSRSRPQTLVRNGRRISDVVGYILL